MKTVHSFCTLFDSNYLTRGLALYHSLKRYMPNAELYVFAFDELCYQTLTELNLEDLHIIRLQDFEDIYLLEVKSSRTRAEYCWTCTPSVILYCLQKFNIESCTYLDADIYFFSSPLPLLNEAIDSSVSLTEHNYSKNFDQTKTSGKYCVQFMTFRNDDNGLKILKWWRDKCLDWCFNRFEDGKFGDQKYLDDWTERFERVHVLKNIGSGIAPWNIQNFSYAKKGSKIQVSFDKDYGDLIFFHFHSLKFYKTLTILSGYPTSAPVIEHIYEKYLEEISKINEKLKKDENNFNGTTSLTPNQELKIRIKSLLLRKPVIR